MIEHYNIILLATQNVVLIKYGKNIGGVGVLGLTFLSKSAKHVGPLLNEILERALGATLSRAISTSQRLRVFVDEDADVLVSGESVTVA